MLAVIDVISHHSTLASSLSVVVRMLQTSGIKDSFSKSVVGAFEKIRQSSSPMGKSVVTSMPFDGSFALGATSVTLVVSGV